MQSFKLQERGEPGSQELDFFLQCSWGKSALHECLNKITFMRFINI